MKRLLIFSYPQQDIVFLKEEIRVQMEKII
jgi:hypothetical protein